MLPRQWSAALAASLCITALPSHGQDMKPSFNYDESKVPAYKLPNPLLSSGGKPVQDSQTWTQQRRGEVLNLFRSHVYGRSPAAPSKMKFAEVSSDPGALGGLATRKELDILFTGKADGPKMRLLLYVPNGAPQKVPAFLGLNFQGNHSIAADPAITLSTSWMRSNGQGVTNNRSTEASRGAATNRWPLETILSRGYALATIYYGDIEPDHVDGWKNSVRSTFKPERAKGASASPAPKGAPKGASGDEWGAIAAWAWGLSRGLDCLETIPGVDAKHVAVLGHSRLGKTALWAGATDERFAIVISNNSGCGGAALSRRAFGETVERINTSFPHWFCGNFKRYNARENALPVDQHELIALMAPRPVYIASAEQDLWADPKGEFLSGKYADPVYALFKKTGLGLGDQPPINTPVGDFIGYHVRTGKHDVTAYDWEQYLNFADRHFGKR